jgi:hypothetical protein
MQEVVQEYNKVRVVMLSQVMVEIVPLVQVVVLVLVVQVLLCSDILSHLLLQFSHFQTQVHLSYQKMYHK